MSINPSVMIRQALEVDLAVFDAGSSRADGAELRPAGTTS